MIHLCHIFTEQRIHSAHVADFFFSMCSHFFSNPYSVDQGLTALLRVPLKSLPSLSDVLPLLNMLVFCRTDQRPAWNSSKGFIQKKKDVGRHIRCVAWNKLDGYPILVERTSKGKGGTMSVKLWLLSTQKSSSIICLQIRVQPLLSTFKM